jgi:hypothetical protein
MIVSSRRVSTYYVLWQFAIMKQTVKRCPHTTQKQHYVDTTKLNVMNDEQLNYTTIGRHWHLLESRERE